MQMDLTNYAPLFLFIMFGAIILFGIIAYKVSGKEGAITTAVLGFIGIWISLGIVKICGFQDASPETVITLIIGTDSFPAIYALYSFNKYIILKKEQRRLQKKIDKENEIKEIILRKEMEIESSKEFIRKNKEVSNLLALFCVLDNQMSLHGTVIDKINAENEKIGKLKLEIKELKNSII